MHLINIRKTRGDRLKLFGDGLEPCTVGENPAEIVFELFIVKSVCLVGPSAEKSFKKTLINWD
jgi:hypothetical protein